MTITASSLASRAYECVEEPERWQIFLEQYAAAVGAASAILISHDTDQHVTKVVAAVDVDLPFQRRYGSEYANRDPYLKRVLAQAHLGVVIPGHAVCPEEELERTEYYQEYLRPQNIFHSLGALFPAGGGLVNIGATRARGQERFGDLEAQAAQQLIPHVQRSLDLSRKLRVADRSIAAADALYRLELPLVVFDRQGTALFANAAAEELFRQQDGLQLRNGKLRAERSAESAALDYLLTSALVAAERGSPAAEAGVRVTRKSMRRSYAVSVYPMPGRSAAGAAARAIALIADLDSAAKSEPQRLASLFGLTPAEARVAQQVCSGQTLKEASDTLHVSIETVRTHIKRAMSKTGVRRQAELVRLLLTVSTTAAFRPQTTIPERITRPGDDIPHGKH